MEPDIKFKNDMDKIAHVVHEFYRQLARREGWTIKYDVDFSELPEEIRNDNRAAAARIPRVLSVAGLYVVPKNATESDNLENIRDILAQNMERLAEVEHKGWMEEKKRRGWKYGERRDDRQKLHPSLKPYTELSEEDKEKDRNNIRNYIELLEKAGYKIVSSI